MIQETQEELNDFAKKAGLTVAECSYIEDVTIRHLITQMTGLPLVDAEDVQKILEIFDKVVKAHGSEIPENLKLYADNLRAKYSGKKQNAPSTNTPQ